MKLNIECMKDIMFALEDLLAFDSNGNFCCVAVWRVEAHDLIKGNYAYEDVMYSLLQLHEAGYIVSNLKVDIVRWEISISVVMYITPKGHDFIAAAKEPNIWRTTKGAMKTATSFSLKLLETAISSAMEMYVRGQS